ncbi:uncharacterized protein CCOS01_06163 [Colletotrichum costaricense]|uniref:Uncharacterized protein n=1 Tax=Colletotrichum costaricense TaxID=1209916 RepID=A0AAJ0E402_9PEZI|nr:uncharacterized protein CCOS01_06163 [Colletotrichum costaricense]KAK1531060.1 hypothetical protein CCOS01_06163 [Colletotrichum costaricense]
MATSRRIGGTHIHADGLLPEMSSSTVLDFSEARASGTTPPCTAGGGGRRKRGGTVLLPGARKATLHGEEDRIGS